MYGASQASNFKFSPVNPTVGAGDIIKRGLAAEEELYGGPGPQVQALPENLAQIDGLTEELMNQWSEAKQFADTMWHNYRIDVTKPDVRNPLAVKAAQAFMKATAGIQYGGQKLKDYNSRLGKTDTAIAEGEGLYVRDPRQQYYEDPNDYFASTKLQNAVIQGNQYNANKYETKEGYEQALDPQVAHRNFLLDQAAKAEAKGDLGQAEYFRIQASGVRDPKRERDWQRDIPRGGGNTTPDPRTIFDEATNIRIGISRGDKSMYDRLRFSNPNISSVTPVTGNNPGAIIRYKDGSKPLRINLNDPLGGYDVIMDILQSNDPSSLRVTSNQLLPWIQQVMGSDGSTIQPNKAVAAEMQAYTELFKSAYTDGNTNVENGVTITAGQKKEKFRRLSQIASINGLEDPNGGRMIKKLEWKKNAEGRWVVQLYESNKDGDLVESLELDPEDSTSIDYFNRLIEENEDKIAKNQNKQENKNQYKNAGEVGTQKKANKSDVNITTNNPTTNMMFSGSGTNTDIKSRVKSTVDLFERMSQR